MAGEGASGEKGYRCCPVWWRDNGCCPVGRRNFGCCAALLRLLLLKRRDCLSSPVPECETRMEMEGGGRRRGDWKRGRGRRGEQNGKGGEGGVRGGGEWEEEGGGRGRESELEGMGRGSEGEGGRRGRSGAAVEAINVQTPRTQPTITNQINKPNYSTKPIHHSTDPIPTCKPANQSKAKSINQ